MKKIDYLRMIDRVVAIKHRLLAIEGTENNLEIQEMRLLLAELESIDMKLKAIKEPIRKLRIVDGRNM